MTTQSYFQFYLEKQESHTICSIGIIWKFQSWNHVTNDDAQKAIPIHLKIIEATLFISFPSSDKH